MELQVTNIED